MKQTGFIKLALVLVVTGLTMGYQACSQNSFGGRGPASENINNSTLGTPILPDDGKPPGLPPAQNNGGTTTDNPKPTIDLTMGGYNTRDVQSAELCLGQIKLYAADGTIAAIQGSSSSGQPQTNPYDTIQLWQDFMALAGYGSSSNTYLQESLNNQRIILSPSGTYMQAVQLPAGEYQQVDLELSTNCNGGNSFAMMNSYARISVRQAVTMHFVGHAKITAADPSLTLTVAPVMTALRSARTSADVERVLESAAGGM
ncbi:MAG: hypothetical protein KF799_08840 [Bdellovibrionales bacterium]|nr:hypothetical protein [Bdellovibrionales bacterium]